MQEAASIKALSESKQSRNFDLLDCFVVMPFTVAASCMFVAFMKCTLYGT